MRGVQNLKKMIAYTGSQVENYQPMYLAPQAENLSFFDERCFKQNMKVFKAKGVGSKNRNFRMTSLMYGP